MNKAPSSAIPAKQDNSRGFWIQLMITNACNLRCKLCHIYQEKPSCDTDPAKVKDLIASVIKNSGPIECFSFTGGEPFLRMESVTAILKLLLPLAATGRVKEINANTNGTQTAAIRSYISLFPARLRKKISFNISLDGLSGQHTALRGKGSFLPVIRTIDLLRHNALPVTLNYVISPFNAADIYPVYKLGKKASLELEYNIYADNTPSFYHYSRKLDLKDDQLWKTTAVSQIDRILDDGATGCSREQLHYIRHSLSTGEIPDSLTRRCLRPRKLIFIRATGEIYSCFYSNPLAGLNDFKWPEFMSNRKALIDKIHKTRCRGCLLGSLKYV